MNTILETTNQINVDRFTIMLFNCMYYNCDINKSWYILGSQLNYNRYDDQPYFSYFIKSCCCIKFNSGLWVSEEIIKDQNLNFLILKFNNKEVPNNISQLYISNIDTISVCDKMIDFLFEDSNHIKLCFDDFDWLMRYFDPNHLHYYTTD